MSTFTASLLFLILLAKSIDGFPETTTGKLRGSPHFVIFGTKRNHEIGGITKLGDSS